MKGLSILFILLSVIIYFIEMKSHQMKMHKLLKSNERVISKSQ